MKHIIHASRSIIARLNRIERTIFVVGSIVMVISIGGFLTSYIEHQTIRHPLSGGRYNEGVVGAPKFINPVLATSQTDKDLVKLIYAGLTRKIAYGTYVPDMATCAHTSPTVVECRINERAKFHDGKPVLADDVEFTITTLKELANRNPVGNLWLGIDTSVINDRTIRFTLPEKYSGFDELLTQGIIPKHIWIESNAETIENHPANLQPIGSGPYRLVRLSTDSKAGITHVTMRRFRRALSPAHITTLRFSVFPDTDSLVTAVRRGSVDGALLPEYRNLSKHLSQRVRILPTTQIYSLFIKSGSNPMESAERVTLGSLIAQFQNSSLWPTGLAPAYQVIPEGLASSPYRDIMSSQESESSLDSSLEITTSNSPELVRAAEQFSQFLSERGIQTHVNVFDRGEIIQRAIRNREFSLLLFGQTYQHPADTFAFWHSSQRTDPGLNITNYASSRADTLIENIVHSDSAKNRTESYEALGQLLKRDAPALPFFMGSYQYILPHRVTPSVNTIASPEDRWNDISQWYIRSYRSW